MYSVQNWTLLCNNLNVYGQNIFNIDLNYMLEQFFGNFWNIQLKSHTATLTSKRNTVPSLSNLPPDLFQTYTLHYQMEIKTCFVLVCKAQVLFSQMVWNLNTYQLLRWLVVTVQHVENIFPVFKRSLITRNSCCPSWPSSSRKKQMWLQHWNNNNTKAQFYYWTIIQIRSIWMSSTWLFWSS